MSPVLIDVSAGYENLALQRETAAVMESPYAQLDVDVYEELPDRSVTALPPTPSATDMCNANDDYAVPSCNIASSCDELDAYEDNSEWQTSEVEPHVYENLNAVVQ